LAFGISSIHVASAPAIVQAQLLLSKKEKLLEIAVVKTLRQLPVLTVQTQPENPPSGIRVKSPL